MSKRKKDTETGDLFSGFPIKGNDSLEKRLERVERMLILQSKILDSVRDMFPDHLMYSLKAETRAIQDRIQFGVNEGKSPSLVRDILWPVLRPLIRVNSASDSSHLLFELPDIPESTATVLRYFTVPCAECGSPVSLVRKRKGWGSYFLAFTCPISKNPGCARSKKVREVVKQLAIELGFPGIKK